MTMGVRCVNVSVRGVNRSGTYGQLSVKNCITQYHVYRHSFTSVYDKLLTKKGAKEAELLE